MMNIFVLHTDPALAARMHCDKHVVKMIVEYAQLLSTAHRVLDGKLTSLPPSRRKLWLLSGESLINIDDKLVIDSRFCGFKCYKATHVNHPAAVWVRQSSANYNWLFQLLCACLSEFRARYGKEHATSRLLPFLACVPISIPYAQQTPFPQAMPVEYRHVDPVEAYRAFYIGAKAKFARWSRTPTPSWFTHDVHA